MKIGIRTPYAWRSVTQLSLELATVLQHLGHDVWIQSAQDHQPDVDGTWDGRVVSYRQPMASQLHGTALVFWIGCQPSGDDLQLLPHVPFAVWLDGANLTVSDLTAFGVGRSRLVIIDNEYQRRLAEDRWHIPAAYTLPVSPHACTEVPRHRSAGGTILVPLEGSALKRWSPRLFYWFEILLNRNPTLAITVLRGAGWKRPFEQACREVETRTNRLHVLRTQRHSHWLLEYWKYDWTLLADPCPSSLWYARCSLSYGTPVVGFNSPPLATLAKTEAVRLMACRTEQNDLGVVSAVPDDRMLQDLNAIVCDEPLWCRSMQAAKQVAERNRAESLTRLERFLALAGVKHG